MLSSDLPVFDHTDHGIKILEEERRRIARDLHDGPAELLTNVSLRLDMIRQLMNTDVTTAAQELIRANSRIVAAVNDIRKLIYDLRPIAIDEVGLISATAELCRRCERDWRIAFNVQVAENVRCDVSPAKQVALYRLIHEILSNVRKHAAASHVFVSFESQESGLVIAVADNGTGFNPDSIPVAGHYGIAGLREFARYLGAELDIQSSLGAGSRFTLTVPSSHGE